MNAKPSFHAVPDELSPTRAFYLRLLLIIIFSIFFAEVAAMFIIYELPGNFEYSIITFIDAGIMTLLIFPVLYFLSFQPLLRHIEERRKAEKATQAERQRFNDILEELPAYIVLLTPDYHVTFANRFFRERFGESNGRRCYEYLFERNEPCEICETYKVLKTMQPGRWEWTGPDDSIYDVYDHPFVDADGATMILEMGIDITYQKIAEAEVREMALFPALNPDCVLQVDNTGKIRKVNPTAVRLGFSVGAHLSEVIPDLDELDLHVCIASGTTEQVYQPHLADRILHWRIQGAPELGLAFLYSSDVTELKRAEEEKALLSAIVEQTADTVVVTNCDGDIEYVNQSFERLTGYTREETLGKTPRVLKSDVHDSEFYRNMWGTIVTGEVFQSEIANRKKNGEIYYEVKTITPLRDAQGRITHFVATGKDITEHKRDEEKLRRAFDELEVRVQERTEELRIAISELEEEIAERQRVEAALRTANGELTRFNSLMVGRELRMVELKKEVNELCASLSQSPRYSLEFAKEEQ